MGAIRFTNNASATLAAGITSIDTSLTLGSGQGSLFPSVTVGQYSKITIEDVLGNLEILHMTARAGDVMTVTRGQEGTTPLDFPSGSRVELRVTAATLTEFIQRAGDTITGSVLTGGNWNAGEVVNSPIRGETGVTTNQFVVPPGGGAPTIGGAIVYTAANLTQAAINALAFPVGTIIMWYGALGGIPAGFQACDGTNGTPDLRDRFVVGAGTSYAVGASGGANSVTSGAGGAHLPVVLGTALTVNELPAHSHRFFAANYSGDTNADGWGNANVRSIPGEDVGPHDYRSTSNLGDLVIENTGSGAAHSHNTSAVPDHTHSVSTLSPYVALYYIMRV
jgi:microcystin-dependent protein